ncbi:hypothetical protein HQ45_09320 [Porphyromonas crevioricanis]|nr:ribonuclease P protein component [Porphyromonas crevioricanis]KGN88861.1 hypothetical protein HQ45_09320 [Porphyromonas crevioricanis]KGN95865.1 hypothetical protein HQ38_02550 [Porphyromonas crevioricanis]SJZ73223.1 ribonuclease P protein component [Porphyromonas crevioricanis]
MSNSSYSLSKAERLYLREQIADLHRKGKSFVAYPLRVVWLVCPIQEEVPPLRMLVSVAKRRFRRANKRNRIKRLVRENHRLRKLEISEFLSDHGLQLDLAYMMVGEQLPSFDEIGKAVTRALNRIQKELV